MVPSGMPHSSFSIFHGIMTQSWYTRLNSGTGIALSFRYGAQWQNTWLSMAQSLTSSEEGAMPWAVR